MRNAAALAEQFLDMNLTPEAFVARRRPQSMAKPGTVSQQTRNRQPADVRLRAQKLLAQTELPAAPEWRHQQKTRLPRPPSTTQQQQPHTGAPHGSPPVISTDTKGLDRLSQLVNLVQRLEEGQRRGQRSLASQSDREHVQFSRQASVCSSQGVWPLLELEDVCPDCVALLVKRT